MGVVRVGVFLGGSCPGENFPGGNFPGWEFTRGTYPGWEFSLVEVFRVKIVRWESSGWEFSCYRNQLCWSLFLMKLQSFRSATLLERDSYTGVLLSLLRKF